MLLARTLPGSPPCRNYEELAEDAEAFHDSASPRGIKFTKEQRIWLEHRYASASIDAFPEPFSCPALGQTPPAAG